MADMSIQKRRSGTMSGAEKITGVKNAQSEMLLARRLNQYQIKLRKNNLVCNSLSRWIVLLFKNYNLHFPTDHHYT